MGRALIGGLLRSGMRSEQLSAGESEAAARATLLREFGVSATDDNRVAVAGAAIVVLAVKPQDAAAVLQPLAAAFALNRPLLISVAAGVRVAALESWCGAGVPVMRAMPNRPARVGAGATGVYAPPAVGAQQRAAAELMAEAATQLGLESGMAHRLAAATLHGSGLLARSGDGDLARLRQEVTSTGGTTEAALRTLEAADLRTTVRAALAAATQRGRELAAVRAG